jgi:CheY-like chemotaxis protein
MMCGFCRHSHGVTELPFQLMQTRTSRVLCVDDDAPTLTLRKTLLEAAGYSVVTAASGTEALRIMGEKIDIDLVLLDYVMPGMNGDELAGRLRRQCPNLRLIAVSAVGQLPPSMLNAVDSFIQKGQDPDVLLSVMAAVLARSVAYGENGQSPFARTVLCVEDELLQLQLRKTLL